MLILVLVGLVSIPAWVPVALTRVSPAPASVGSLLCAIRSLAAVAGSPSRLLSAAGLFFIGRGLIRLLG